MPSSPCVSNSLLASWSSPDSGGAADVPSPPFAPGKPQSIVDRPRLNERFVHSEVHSLHVSLQNSPGLQPDFSAAGSQVSPASTVPLPHFGTHAAQVVGLHSCVTKHPFGYASGSYTSPGLTVPSPQTGGSVVDVVPGIAVVVVTVVEVVVGGT